MSSNKSELHIGIFGTFDLQNYGDLLFPMMAEYELSKRLGDVKIHPFSYHAKTSQNWIYNVQSLADLPEKIHHLDGVLIGGGHIIRFDKQVAINYFPPVEDIHHPTGYWLTPMLLALQANIPIIWNAPGVWGKAPDWIMPMLTMAVEQSDYIALRDDWAKELLESFLPQHHTNIHVIPDTIFSLAQLFPIQNPSSDFLNLRQALDLTRPYLVVQGAPGLERIGQLIQENPIFFNNYQILVILTAPVCGDSIAHVEQHLPKFISLPFWPHPRLMAEIIGNAEAVIGMSLHLSITALAYGKPVFRPAYSAHRKYDLLRKFDTVYFFNDEPIALEWFTSRLKSPAVSPQMLLTLNELSRHWDEVAKILSAPLKKEQPIAAIQSIWQKFPVMLETYVEKLSAKEECIVIQNQTIDARNTRIEDLLASNSWKITSPFRYVSNKLKQLKNKIIVQRHD